MSVCGVKKEHQNDRQVELTFVLPCLVGQSDCPGAVTGLRPPVSGVGRAPKAGPLGSPGYRPVVGDQLPVGAGAGFWSARPAGRAATRDRAPLRGSCHDEDFGALARQRILG